MKIREAELLREKSEWLAAQQQINQYIEGLHMEKDEMIRRHTLETAELRKKNNILRETMEKLESQLKASNNGSSNNSTSTFSNEFSDFENLTMDSSPWEDFSMVNGLSLETEPLPASSAPDNSALLPPTKNEKAEKAAKDYPFSWNAFYMCLLFGAFIVSNSARLSTATLPQLSEEYRAESANVLKAVLASAPPEVSSSTNQAPAASASSNAAPLPTTISGAEMAQMTSVSAPAVTAPSSLDELHNALAMPTKEQENEQVFSLNADQYNALTTFEDDGVDFKPQQPSNLQQALAAMRNNGAHKSLEAKVTSDVYTRSLLWDRVPEKVVRDFKRMVRECGAGLDEKADTNN